jgi:hypothetical protein
MPPLRISQCTHRVFGNEYPPNMCLHCRELFDHHRQVRYANYLRRIEHARVPRRRNAQHAVAHCQLPAPWRAR